MMDKYFLDSELPFFNVCSMSHTVGVVFEGVQFSIFLFELFLREFWPFEMTVYTSGSKI